MCGLFLYQLKVLTCPDKPANCPELQLPHLDPPVCMIHKPIGARNRWAKVQTGSRDPEPSVCEPVERIPLELLSEPKNEVIRSASLNRPLTPKNLGEYLGSMNNAIHILH